MYLFGKNSILERIKTHPESIKKIFVYKNFFDKKILNAIKEKNIPFLYVEKNTLLNIKTTERFQDIIAEADNFRYTDFEIILNRNLSLVFLDEITDPVNLGSIIRTCATLGGFGVVLPRHRACGVNETVVGVALGAENYVPVCRVTNLSQALKKAKDSKYWIVGTVVGGGKNIYNTDLPFPICLVMGSEGQGIRWGIEKYLDIQLTLPMATSLSLNVAVACAIFCYEIKRQERSLIKGC
jgi:23S rRNA (guanosine2251-2'-O)-methyltransferase